MGSDSDLPVMREAATTLQELDVPWEMRCLSAHRDAEAVRQYAHTAAERGRRVIIAGAGMSAALPGALAACTSLPVIGVPLLGKSLGGADALYSMVQMPPGVPVATVGINAARNAAILAAQILAVGNPALKIRLERLRIDMVGAAVTKDAAVQAEARRILGGER